MEGGSAKSGLDWHGSIRCWWYLVRDFDRPQCIDIACCIYADVDKGLSQAVSSQSQCHPRINVW